VTESGNNVNSNDEDELKGGGVGGSAVKKLTQRFDSSASPIPEENSSDDLSRFDGKE